MEKFLSDEPFQLIVNTTALGPAQRSPETEWEKWSKHPFRSLSILKLIKSTWSAPGQCSEFFLSNFELLTASSPSNGRAWILSMCFSLHLDPTSTQLTLQREHRPRHCSSSKQRTLILLESLNPLNLTYSPPPAPIYGWAYSLGQENAHYMVILSNP